MSLRNETWVVMGVSGVGKTAVARGLAESVPSHYVEADDFHTPENIEAMQSGKPLTDEMRRPWLEAITAEVRAIHKAHPGCRVVLACSALKRSYREVLSRGVDRICFIHLVSDRDIISARLSTRKNHFFSPNLLDSQFATLEDPIAGENFVKINANKNLPDVIADVCEHVKRGIINGSVSGHK